MVNPSFTLIDLMAAAPLPFHYLLINSQSGTQKSDVRQVIEDSLREHACAFEWVELKGDMLSTIRDTAARAKAKGGVIVAAGGDGTVGAVAAECYRQKVEMAVIPLGTFNYFARMLGISTDPKKAAAQLCNADIISVPAGFVGDNMFLNNASLGLYTKVIRHREEVNAKFKRIRLLAVISTAYILLRGMAKFSVQLKGAPVSSYQRTALIFTCINPMQLENLGLSTDCIQKSQLSVHVMKRNSRRTTIRLLLKGIARMLENDQAIESFCTEDFSVHTRREQVDVVIDGEIIRMESPLHFRIEPDALKVARPREAA